MSATIIENPPADAEQETTTELQPTAPDPAADAEGGLTHAIGELEWHYPEDLVLDAYNHRKQIDTEPDATLKASVRDIGVQEPVGARPQADGKIGIFKGQRRWKAQLAANREADRKKKPRRKIPVLVRRDLAGVDDDTLVLSMIENMQRVQSSQRDVADGLTQLALMDIPAGQRAKHARRLGYKPAEIAAAQRASGLKDENLSKYSTAGWDFVEMADLAEVEELGWDAERALSEARRADARSGNKSRGNWEQAMARLRRDLEEKRRRAALVAELEAAGVAVVHYASWDRNSRVRPLSHLVTPAGKKMTPKAHAELCPDHAAYIDHDKIRPVYACKDWSGNGHTLSPEEAAKNPVEDKEAAKANARRVREGNAAWRAARDARRAFLIRLINPGKDGPKEVSDAAWSWIMLATSGNTRWFARYYGSSRRLDELAVLLKTEAPKTTYPRDEEPFAHVVKRRGRPGRPFILLAQVAAAFEREEMHDMKWRNPDDAAAGWLEFLAGEGYTLAACEQELIAEVTAKQQEAAAKAKKSDEEAEKELDAALADAAAESGELLDAEDDDQGADGGELEEDVSDDDDPLEVQAGGASAEHPAAGAATEEDAPGQEDDGPGALAA
ncbi:ParB/RepB/Spo0J family partition protein [Streptomyces sp. NRRL B-24484]|uniref:ParB/RepB/Spo0J family partition protein n=1 Tax=Streptomyces sp. NRRL B-24484 TaxID=1463833 RepID=UPI000694B788|nr:ParB N-terminal domain-containing protein [Streptomyces sp. NRRL B-24484]